VNLNTDVSLSVANNVKQCSFAKNIQALIPFPNYYSMWIYWQLYIKGDTVGLKLLLVSIK
jgi:hypothetical protein